MKQMNQGFQSVFNACTSNLISCIKPPRFMPILCPEGSKDLNKLQILSNPPSGIKKHLPFLQKIFEEHLGENEQYSQAFIQDFILQQYCMFVLIPNGSGAQYVFVFSDTGQYKDLEYLDTIAMIDSPQDLTQALVDRRNLNDYVKISSQTQQKQSSNDSLSFISQSFTTSSLKTETMVQKEKKKSVFKRGFAKMQKK